jgi:hypothetical protein
MKHIGFRLSIALLTFSLGVGAVWSCPGISRITSWEQSAGHLENQHHSRKASLISEKDAIQIATKDATKLWTTLDMFEMTVTELPGSWRVEFELRNKRLNGGGPSYVIDKETGKILSKIINQ